MSACWAGRLWEHHQGIASKLKGRSSTALENKFLLFLSFPISFGFSVSGVAHWKGVFCHLSGFLSVWDPALALGTSSGVTEVELSVTFLLPPPSLSLFSPPLESLPHILNFVYRNNSNFRENMQEHYEEYSDVSSSAIANILKKAFKFLGRI